MRAHRTPPPARGGRGIGPGRGRADGRWTTAGGALAALALVGCHPKKASHPSETVHQAQPASPVFHEAKAIPGGFDGGSPHPDGLRVDLPTGWTFVPSADGSIRAGPSGRTVLRIDLAPKGTALPAAEHLAQSFGGALAGLHADVARTYTGEGFSGVWLSVEHPRKKKLAAHPVFLGARQVGRHLLFCATVPGSTAAEVSEAARACLGIALPR